MVWFYRLDLKEVVNTRTEIPQEQWGKKNILPYRKEYSENQEDVGLVIGETEVVETFYKAPVPVKTFDELKSEKKDSIRLECQNDIYSIYSKEKQLSAALDVYDSVKKSEIKDFVKGKVNICNLAETAIEDATTIEEVDVIYFKKYNFDDDMNPIETIYWGEE